MFSLSKRTTTWVWTISGVLALLSVLPVTNVCSPDGPCGTLLVSSPLGYFVSNSASNTHDPKVILGALLNWVNFATVAIVLLKMWARRKGAPRP